MRPHDGAVRTGDTRDALTGPDTQQVEEGKPTGSVDKQTYTDNVRTLTGDTAKED